MRQARLVLQVLQGLQALLELQVRELLVRLARRVLQVRELLVRLARRVLQVLLVQQLLVRQE